MAIDRSFMDTWIDDSGPGTDGTILDVADFDALLDAVDAEIAAGGGTSIRQIANATATGDFSTSSATLVDVTNASVSITTGASAAVLVFVAVPCAIASGSAYFDWEIDGADVGSVQGVSSTSGASTVTLFRYSTGLSAATHTFQLRVRSSGGGAISINMSSVMVGTLVALEYR